MQKLAGEINEVIHLVIVNQGQATYIEKVDSSRALRLNTRIGKSTPLYTGSGPKLLLAYLPEQEQEKILARPFTTSLADGREINRDELKQELKKIRKQGYAYSIGEQDIDTTGVSFPIFNYEGKVIASLAISGLSSYYEGDNLEKIKNKSQQAAKNISEQLGYRE